MTWPQWVSAVLAIAEQRGIQVSITYPKPGWATFSWECRNGTKFGTAGAGAEMIGLTTPEQFTWLWVCDVTPTLRPPADPLEPRPAKGKRIFDRRVLKAVSAALEELVKPR